MFCISTKKTRTKYGVFMSGGQMTKPVPLAVAFLLERLQVLDETFEFPVQLINCTLFMNTHGYLSLRRLNPCQNILAL